MILETYWSRRRLVSNQTQKKSFAYQLIPVSAFAGLFLLVLAIFITVTLIHKNLAPMETSAQILASVPRGTPYLLESRPYALAAMVKPIDDTSVEITFDNGRKFLFPDEQHDLRAFLTKKAAQLVESAVLLLSETPGSSRVQLWPDKDLSAESLDILIGEFTAVGFDDFDIAVTEEVAVQ